MSPDRTLVRTIGHSNHPIGHFIALLERAGIECVVDVRSVPWSRRFPQFGRDRLAAALTAAGIAYIHEGTGLGGKPPEGGTYDDVARRPAFVAALDRVVVGARERRLCLMCAEKEPLDCHRTVLVSRRLAERGVEVEHLLGNGERRPHRAIEETLLAAGGGPDLFEDRAARLARAWTDRERAMKRG